jgi:ribulose-phosphate 3-epimerase
MFGNVQIAPSLLSADFLNLERDVRLIERERPEWLHVDVMDGHFVPNLTIGPPVIKLLKKMTNIPLDVHLMISNPAEQLDWFLEAGADLVTVHVETGGDIAGGAGGNATGGGAGGGDATGGGAGGAGAPNTTPTIPGTSFTIDHVENTAPLIKLVERIHAAGARAGLSLNPGTPASVIEPFVGIVDLILIMSVHPGFGGQSFIDATLDKIAQIVAFARTAEVNPLLEVDGGIDTQTAALVAARGADVLVAGNAIFGAPDPCAALREIREATRR